MDVKKGLVALLVLVAAGIAIWSWRDSVTPGGPVAATGEDPSAVAAQRAGRNVDAASSEEGQVSAPPADAREAVALPDAKQATLFGRCVDGAGAPVPGCRVQVRGRRGNQERGDAWRLDHGELPPPMTHEAVTDAEGRFELTFWPPPPFQFALDIAEAGCADMSARWSTLPEGERRDLGDIVMEPGIAVRARVVDGAGVAVADVDVSVRRRDRPSDSDRVLSRAYSNARTDAAGVVALRGSFAAGLHDVRVYRSGRSLRVVSPTEVTLDAARPVEELVVTVEAGDQPPRITGRVIDDRGEPIAGVWLRSQHATEGASGSGQSKRDGTFVLTANGPAPSGPVRLIAETDAYEQPAEPPPPVDWGAEGVEVRLGSAGTLTVRVTDDAGEPVERYGVRLVAWNRRMSGSTDARVRLHGPHNDGTARVAGLTKGEWVLFVEFPDDSGLRPHTEHFTNRGGDHRVDLQVGVDRERTLRVVDAVGQPVAGAAVQLCELFGVALHDYRPVVDAETWVRGPQKHALIVFEGTTADDGRLVLRGPGGRELGLVLPGPGHVSKRQAGVRLDVGTELVVRVARGATLVGRIVPAEAFAELKRVVGAGVDEPWPARRRPAVQLVGEGGARYPTFQMGRRLEVEDDGTFEFDGLPGGQWTAAIQYWRVSEHGGTQGVACHVPLVLVDGERRALDLDASAVLPGEFEATVTFNGEPVTQGTISLNGATAGGVSLVTDEDGRVRADVPAGDYGASVFVRMPDDSTLTVPHTRVVRIERGELTTERIDLRVGRLTVVVRDAQGDPVRGVLIGIDSDTASRPPMLGGWLPPTDANGRSSVLRVAEAVTLRVLPKRLYDPEVQRELYEQARARGEGDPLQRHWIVLGTAAVSVDDEAKVELTLPAEAGY